MPLFPVSFESLRTANIARLPEFKNRAGERAHSEPDGSDWSIAEWTNAIAGEVGEACNIAKKIRRGDFGTGVELIAAVSHLMDELADVVIYADIAAYQLKSDLGIAVRNKFNRVSERDGLTTFIGKKPSMEGIQCNLVCYSCDKAISESRFIVFTNELRNIDRLYVCHDTPACFQELKRGPGLHGLLVEATSKVMP